MSGSLAPPGAEGGSPEQGPEQDDEWRLPPDRSDWVPPEIDLSRPSVARLYHHALGGKSSFPVDRELYDTILQTFPEYPSWARANRDFLHRAVRYLAERGVRQFLDLGAGIPFGPNVHEVARESRPDARVAYVDHDPVALTHSRALLPQDQGIAVVDADLREPDQVLSDEAVRSVVRTDQPLGLLLVAVLHFVRHDVSLAVLDRYVQALAPGSHVVVSLVCRHPELEHAGMARARDAVDQLADADLTLRTRSQTEALFEALDPVEPGIVETQHWRSGDPDAPFVFGLAGVGRVPGESGAAGARHGR